MVSRFDHAVIAVPDLADAISRYRSLGFQVTPGGRHAGLGTHNAVIRFGLDYIELLGVHDEAEARRQEGRSALLDFLDRHGGGLLGYALATADIAEDAHRLVETELPAVGPFPMSRTRPDGRILSWRLVIPGGLAWRRPWPFLIQWDASDADRLAWEAPGVHPNGATGVRSVRILVQDQDRGRDLYRRQLGLSPSALDRSNGDPSFDLGAVSIELVSVRGDPRLAPVLAEEGEGLHELVLATRDLATTEALLRRNGLDVVHDQGRVHSAGVATVGARLAFTSGGAAAPL